MFCIHLNYDILHVICKLSYYGNYWYFLSLDIMDAFRPSALVSPKVTPMEVGMAGLSTVTIEVPPTPKIILVTSNMLTSMAACNEPFLNGKFDS